MIIETIFNAKQIRELCEKGYNEKSKKDEEMKWHAMDYERRNHEHDAYLKKDSNDIHL